MPSEGGTQGSPVHIVIAIGDVIPVWVYVPSKGKLRQQGRTLQLLAAALCHIQAGLELPKLRCLIFLWDIVNIKLIGSKVLHIAFKHNLFICRDTQSYLELIQLVLILHGKRVVGRNQLAPGKE